jgi:FG-GAP repeat
MNASALAVVPLLALIAASAAAQCLPEHLQHLVAADKPAFDALGLNAALDGGRAVFGVESDGQFAPAGGAAYVFDFDGSQWDSGIKLHAADATFAQLFGSAVDVSGDRVVVGALQDATQGGAAGAVYVFEKTASGWQQVAKLTGSDGSPGDNLGTSVAIDGDTIVAGAPNEDLPFLNAGAAYVFERQGSTWTQVAKLTGADITLGAGFGGAVAIDGERLVVGAVSAPSGLQGQGAAYVFERLDGTWTQTAKLVPGDAFGNKQFGGSVALDGELVVVGQPQDTTPLPQSGSAYVFAHSSGGWTQQAKLLPDPPNEYGIFGTSVAVVDGPEPRILVGEPDDISGGEAFGAVALFEWLPGWVQTARLGAPNPSTADRYGRSVAMSGGLGVIGMPGDDVVVTSTGAAWTIGTCTWKDLGGPLPGASGPPQLAGDGPLLPGSHGAVALTAAAASAPALLLVAIGPPGAAPFKGGVLQAVPVTLTLLASTGPTGGLALPFDMPAGFSGQGFVLQWAIADAGAPAGVALSNGLRGQAP